MLQRNYSKVYNCFENGRTKNIQRMSEHRTTNIQTMPKSERKGIQSSDFWAFGTTPQLSEIQTGHPHHNTTFKFY